MKVVIDVTDEMYANVKAELERGVHPSRDARWTRLLMAICRGQILPKGHGRLIDADALEFDTEYDGYCDGFTAYSSMAIGDAPTIIEADKEGADNE